MPAPLASQSSTAAAAAAGSTPLSKIELRLSAENLPNMDVLSLTDAQVYVSQFNKSTKNWNPIGATEVVWDNLNPKFVKSIVIDYYFEEEQLLRFTVVDVDKDTGNLADHNIIGTVEAALADIVSSQKVSPRAIVNAHKKPCGTLTILAEELPDINDEITIHFKGSGLEKKGFLSMFHQALITFLVISRSREDGVWTPVHRTENSERVATPAWKPFTVPLATMCSGDRDRALKFEIFEFYSSGRHHLIAETTASVNEIVKLAGSSLTLKNVGKLPRVPSLEVLSCGIKKAPSFLDYVFGGTEISLIVGIDCTASNGDPTDRNSLHFMGHGVVNEYQSAIQFIGALAHYDSDKKFPLFGFGAVLQTGVTSHCFAMNGNPYNPEVDGIQGILDTYRGCITQVKLHGPTNFAPIINESADIIRRTLSSGRMVYYILLIITDGEISDFDSTKRAIIQACDLPFSIVIVGVGSADFNKMEQLDGDDSPLSSDPNFRDIVQFVPMREYRDPSMQSKLPSALLAEIPDQLVSYMTMKNIMPNLPRYNS